MIPQYLDAVATFASATITECADALEAALRSGMPGLADPPREFMELPNGEMLIMPSRATGIPTIKIVTIMADADGPPPRIKGVHLVFDPVTLAPTVIMDAAALTVMRTTAISIVALRALADSNSSTLVVFGGGPQGSAHLDAVIAEWPITRAIVVARRPERVADVLTQARARHPHVQIDLVRSSDADAHLRGADIVVCATTATEPLFADPGHDLAAVAVGAHASDVRELPGALVARAFVAVENREAALREAGDIALPIADGLMSEQDIDADLLELVRSPAPRTGARVFKSMGMGWEDAVVSALLSRRHQSGIGSSS